ncbi:substrate-binding domain-containing protein [Marinibacterium sp. SX1]|uniref:substrate-binding domain-containing protein n=1 Tax=Marinibacterium sp. SX1 TaxID=3388424 RepID=UPI003D166BC8
MAPESHSSPGAEAPIYLTTREVADLLRVKERKVYDLAAADEIPHRRITGKLLFPRAELQAWIDGDGPAEPAERPAVLTGSHDPLLDWAVRESGAGLATLLNGSAEGLEVYDQGRAALAGLHLPEDDGWNRRSVAARGLRDCVLVGWAKRARGLILAPEVADRVAGFGDLRGLRVVMRQPGAGAAALFDRLLDEHGFTPSDLRPYDAPARTESDAAAAVAAGEAEAALGIEAMARQFNLAFRPILTENFDLLIDRRAYFTDPVQDLLAFARGEALQRKALAMGGYDLGEAGVVRWLSP